MLPDLSSIMLCYWQSWFISFIILFKQGYFVFSICPLCLVVLLLVKHTTWYLESLFRVWNFWSIWRYIFLLLTDIEVNERIFVDCEIMFILCASEVFSNCHPWSMWIYLLPTTHLLKHFFFSLNPLVTPLSIWTVWNFNHTEW